MITDLKPNEDFQQDENTLRIISLIDELEKKADIIITDDQTNDEANKISLIAKDYYNQLEKIRKAVKEPVKKLSQKIDSYFSEFTERAEKIRKKINNQILIYFNKKEEERIKQEEKNAKKIERAILNDKPMPVLDTVITKPQLRNENGGLTSITKVWTFDVINIDEVPRTLLYCEPNKQAINGLIKSGIREISGLKIYEKSDIKQRV